MEYTSLSGAWRVIGRTLIFGQICLALTAMPSQAEWQSMGGSAESELFVDAERLRRAPDGTVTFWQLEVLNMPRKAANGRAYASITQRFSLRCEAGTYSLRGRFYHPKANGEGGTVFSDPLPASPRWMAAENDSDMERWLPSMCYRANVLELFEKRDRESQERLQQMR